MLLSPINPADLLVLADNYPHPISREAVLGAEGVGEILEVGRDVTGFSVGDRVIPLTRGNWASHRILRAKDLVKVPAELSLDQAATLRINPATAWRLLRRSGAKPGESIVQNAAYSSVAGYVRIFAAESNIEVINLAREIEINCNPEEWLHDQDGIRLSGQTPVAALDCVAGQASGRLAKLLSQNGRLIVFGHLSGQPCSIPSTYLTGKNLSVHGFSLRTDENHAAQPELQALYTKLSAMIVKHGATPAVRAIVPLSQVGEALGAARTAERGRILLDCSQ